jgi:NAD(P)H-flavin reductase
LKEKGNRVIVFIEGRSKFLLYWIDRMKGVADEVLLATKDGSIGQKEGYPHVVYDKLTRGEHIDRVIAIGCTFMMYQMSQTTRPFEVKTIVSLNPIMIDGTGMCGACRVVVDGQTKFACVDGPDFDAHLVDWDLLFARRKAYLGPETDSAER